MPGQIKAAKQGNGQSMTVHGPLGFAECEGFFKALDEIEADDDLFQQKMPTVILEMRKCSSIDSAGMGMLMVLHDSLQACRGTKVAVKLRGANHDVRRILKLARLEELFQLT